MRLSLQKLWLRLSGSVMVNGVAYMGLMQVDQVRSQVYFRLKIIRHDIYTAVPFGWMGPGLCITTLGFGLSSSTQNLYRITHDRC